MGQTRSRWHRVRSMLLVGDDAAPAACPDPAPDALVLDRVTAGVDASAHPAAAWLRGWHAVPGRPLLLVAIGALDQQGTDRALAAVMPARPDAIVVRGCADAAALQQCSVKLGVYEAMHGWPAGSTAIVAEIATPAAVLALPGLAGASSRLVGLSWDAAALAFACGADTDLFAVPDGPGLVVRTTLALAAAARGIAAYETPLSGAMPLGTLARRLGFAGQMTRDAGEVGVLHAMFDRAVPD